VGCVNHAAVDLELGEGIVDLGGGELVAEGHQLGSEGLGVDLAVLLESLEGSEDDIVIIGTTSHLGGEKGDHLGEVHGSINLIEHSLGITTTNALSMGSKGGHEVGGGEEAVLVSIHDTKSLLELLDGRVGEGLEDICFLGHLGGGVFQVL